MQKELLKGHGWYENKWMENCQQEGCSFESPLSAQRAAVNNKATEPSLVLVVQ